MELERLRKHEVEMDEWLEIVVCINRRRYRNRHEPDISMQNHKRKLGLKVKPDLKGFARYGYNITMAAYWVFEEDGRFRKKEAELILPEFT